MCQEKRAFFPPTLSFDPLPGPRWQRSDDLSQFLQAAMEPQPQGSVRKNIALKLRDQGGTSPFTKVESGKKEEGDAGRGWWQLAGMMIQTPHTHHTGEGNEEASKYDYSDLKWDHPVNLCGRPIRDPLLHLCEKCSLPVLIYGRMVREGGRMVREGGREDGEGGREDGEGGREGGREDGEGGREGGREDGEGGREDWGGGG